MFLLDTNVVSELRKVQTGKADPRVAKWIKSVDAANLFISAISIYELEKGTSLAERKDPPQGAMFRAWLKDQVLPAFEERILSVDAVVAQRGAQLSVPDPRPLHDGLIAATALVHGMTVVTRNVADLAATGVRLLNPWEP
jgi:predicted nucleic acid-binding protein